MYDPVTRGLLPDPFFHKRLLATKELHSQLVVCWLEQGLKLIFQKALLDLLARETRAWLLLRGPVKGDIVHPEVDLSATLVIHLVACNTIKTIHVSIDEPSVTPKLLSSSDSTRKISFCSINPSRVCVRWRWHEA